MALGTAVRHLKKGDWEKAHAIVQADETALGCWAHGIVHIVEGDLGNAAYWYRRAGKPASQQPLPDEWTAIVKSLLGSKSGQLDRTRE